MPDEWLIDGCNLLHAFPSGKSSRKQASNDRAALLAALAGFSAMKAQRMLVVFDGKGVSAELDVHRTAWLDVIYSQNTSADTCIEKTLYDRRGQARFTVVTDDRAITNIARGTGAFVVGTKPFMEMMKDSRKETSDRQHKDKLDSHGFHRPFDKLEDA